MKLIVLMRMFLGMFQIRFIQEICLVEINRAHRPDVSLAGVLVKQKLKIWSAKTVFSVFFI